MPAPDTVPLEIQDHLPQWLQEKIDQSPSAHGVLLNVLSHLNSRAYELSTYLPRHVVRDLLSRSDVQAVDPGAVEGDAVDGTLLFCDVSGFTALSERLAHTEEGGIERLTELLNDYFQRMLDVLAWSDGILLKFAGDAMLAYFVAQSDNAQAAWAVRAALRMMRSMRDFSTIATPVGSIELRMKIGVATGSFHAMHVGSARRMDYVITGETVTKTMAAEGFAEAGEIIVDDATRDAYPQARYAPRAPGFYTTTLASQAALDGFEIRAGTQRRERRMALWMADTDEILAEITATWNQIRILSAYLPEELVAWLRTRSRSSDHSENRPTAVIFVNVSGFQRLLQTLTPVAAAARFVYGLFDDYYRMVHRVVSEYEGIISRVDPYKKGSKVLILFGAPQAHEDDAGRAVRAALAMRQELLQLNRRWEQRLKRELPESVETELSIQQHIGITYGVTFAGQVGSATRKEYTVMGDDVNLAARLMAAAEPDQILLSQAVQDALATHNAGDRVKTTQLSPIVVKGKTNPVVVYQAEGIDRSDGEHVSSRSVPLFGRASELQRAWHATEEILDAKSIQIIIRGEAGIGKSHFVQVLSSRARECDIRVLTAYCAAFGAGPYAPWISVLQDLITETAAGTSTGPTTALYGLLRDLDIHNPVHAQPLFQLLQLPYSSPAMEQGARTTRGTPTGRQTNGPPSLFAQLGQKAEATQRPQPEQSLWHLTQNRHRMQRTPEKSNWDRLDQRIATRAQIRLFEAFSVLVDKLSGQGPMMIVFENAQWIDPASRNLLRHVLKASEGHPLAIAIVERTVESGDLGYRDGTVVVLEALSQGATADLIGFMLEQKTHGEELRRLAQLVYEKSQGNPLVIEELATWYLNHQGSADMTTALRASHTIYELVMSRVDQLAPEQRAVLRCAAVLGDGFSVDHLIVLLSSSLAASTIHQALAELVQDNVLVSAKAASKTTFAFRKTRVREIIYESLPLSQRRAWHQAIASHLEAHHAEDPSAVAELLASHYLGTRQWPAAARYLMMSADKATKHQAYDQAESQYRRALEVVERAVEKEEASAGSMWPRALEGLGDVALMKEELADAIAHYRQALRNIRDLDEGDPIQRRGRLLIKLALVCAGTGDWERAEEAGRQAWDTGTDRLTGVTAATLAWVLWHRRFPEVEVWRRRAQELLVEAPTPESEIIHALMDELVERENKVTAEHAPGQAPNGKGYEREKPHPDPMMALFYVLERSGHQEARDK